MSENVAAEIFSTLRRYSRPKDPLSLSILSFIIALANHEVQEELRKDKTQKSKTVTVSEYSKVILQSQDIFHGKWPTIIPSFFTTTV